MPSGRKQCICQMCTCGRHMCPHRKKEHLVLGSDQSSATKDERRKQRKHWQIPNDKQNISLSTDGLTQESVHTDSKTVAVKVKSKGNVNQASLKYGKSSENGISKTLPIKHPDNLRSEGEADFTTIHQQDFVRKETDYESSSAVKSSSTTKEESWNKKQIPKTQKIKKLDSLALSGPLNMETTHQATYKDSACDTTFSQEVLSQQDSFQRPRTSLKMSGDFQSDSSYQQAYTSKKPEKGIKIKKGTSTSNLKPEGEMTFNTTALDYNAVNQAFEKQELHLKPKLARPHSEIKIADMPISDETTLLSDYRRWKVEKPERHKPLDTIQLGDVEQDDFHSLKTEVKHHHFKEMSSNDERKWHESNLKHERDINVSTKNDTDYYSRRDIRNKISFEMEPLTERTEPDSIDAHERITFEPTENKIDVLDKSIQHMELIDDSKHQSSIQIGHESESVASNGKQTETNNILLDVASSNQEKTRVEMKKSISEGKNFQEEDHYVTWDEIRPKPIRPHSNLRQEGGMEFNTTNRSEFVSRISERVHGIRPKTNPKLFEGDFDATTMNQIMFTNDQAEKVYPIRPKSNLHVEEGDFNAETTSGREFKPWHLEKPAPIIPQSNLTQEGTMDFTTTNRTEFEEKMPDKVFPIRPITTSKISGGLDLTTTNKTMHAEFPIERVQKIVPQSSLRMNSGAFETETTNKMQFQEWSIDRPKPILPVPNLMQEGSIDFTTLNKLQFEGKQIENGTPYRSQPLSKTIEFDRITKKESFDVQPAQKSNQIKPKGNIEIDKSKMSNDTTNNIDYQQWQHVKSNAVIPKNNINSEGSIDFMTTSKSQYGTKPINRVSEIRPKTNSHITGEFDGTTMNQMMFQDSPRSKLKPIKPHNNIELEKGIFSSETTNNKDFQQWEYSKPSPIKQQSTIKQEGDMNFKTTNESEFSRKKIEKVHQIRPITTTKMSGAFESTTTNQAMFQNNPVTAKIRGKKPPNNILMEKGKFQDETTSSKEFQRWKINRPDLIRPSGNLVQEGEMDFRTSNRTEYQEKIAPINNLKLKTSHAAEEFVTTKNDNVSHQANNTEMSYNSVHHDIMEVDSSKFANETESVILEPKCEIKPDPINLKPNSLHEGNSEFIPHETQIEEQFKKEQTWITTENGKSNSSIAQETTLKGKRNISSYTLGSNETDSHSKTLDEYRKWKNQKPSSFQLVSSLTPEGDMQFETTNNAEFRKRTFDKVQPIRPKTTNKILQGDFEATTMNQVMFQGHEKLERVKPIRHENNLHVEKGKFSGETTSNREFKQWVKMENQDSKNKTKAQPPKEKNDHEKSYSEQSVENRIVKGNNEKLKSSELNEKSEIHVHNEKSLTDNKQQASPNSKVHTTRRIEGRHENESVNSTGAGLKQINQVECLTVGRSKTNERIKSSDTYISASKVQQIEPRKEIESPHESRTEKIINEHNTDYSVHTTENAMKENNMVSKIETKSSETSPASKKSKRYRPKDNLQVETVPFEGSSTTKTEYKKWDARRSSSKKRNEALKQEGKMEFETTADDYSMTKSYSMNRETMKSKSKADQKGSWIHSGDLDFHTTQNSDYMGTANTRRQIMKPHSTLKIGMGEHIPSDTLNSTRSNPELTSTSRASFVEHTGSRRTRFHRPSTSQKVGQGSFEAVSTTRSSFTAPQEHANPRSRKPENHNILNTHNGMTGVSTYQKSYDSSERPHCPVIDLQAGRSSLTFNEEKNGHVFYAHQVSA